MQNIKPPMQVGEALGVIVVVAVVVDDDDDDDDFFCSKSEVLGC